MKKKWTLVMLLACLILACSATVFSASADTAQDDGLWTDVYYNNYDGVSADAVAADVYAAIGWAPATGTFEVVEGAEAIGGSGKSIKITPHYRVESADGVMTECDPYPYQDSAYHHNNFNGVDLRVSFRFKPYGNISQVVVMQNWWSYGHIWININGNATLTVGDWGVSDGTEADDKKDITAATAQASVTKENGVYTVSYINKNADDFSHVFKINCKMPYSSTDMNAGVIIDDYRVQKPTVAEIVGANTVYYNVYDRNTVQIRTNMNAVSDVKLDGTALAAEAYTFADGILSLKPQAFGDVDDAATSATVSFTTPRGNLTATVQYVRELWETYTEKDYDLLTEQSDGQAIYDQTGWADIGKVWAVSGDGAIGGRGGSIYASPATNANEGRGEDVYNDKIYPLNIGKVRISMNVKFVGSAHAVEFRGQSWEFGYVYLNKDGTFRLDVGNAAEKNIDANSQITVTDNGDGTYRVSYINFGRSQYHNKILLCVWAAANEQAGAAGVLVDDVKIERVKVYRTTAGAYYFNKQAAYAQDVSIGTNAEYATERQIDSLSVDDQAIAAADYQAVENTVVLKKAYLSTLAVGEHTVTIVNGENATVEVPLTVYDAVYSSYYQNNFATVGSLPADDGGAIAAADLYRLLFGEKFDPAGTPVFKAADGALSVTANATAREQILQTNPRGLPLKSGRLYRFSFAVSATNATALGFDLLRYAADDAQWTVLSADLDLTRGTVTYDATKVGKGDGLSFAECNVTEAGGVYHVTVTFGYDDRTFDDEYSGTVGYLKLYAVRGGVGEATYVFDDFDLREENFPSADAASSVYDTVFPSVNRGWTVKLHGYTVTEVAGETAALSADDWTLTGDKLTLAADYLNALENGDYTFTVKTSKPSQFVLTLTVTDSTPVPIGTQFAFDKADGEEVTLTVDFNGFALDTLSDGEEVVLANNYRLSIDGDTATLTVKATYLAGLATGAHVFTVQSTSGATATFTVTVADSTPVFAQSVKTYDKATGGDLNVAVDTHGAAITRVVLGETTLAAAAYTYAEGTLTLSASVFADLDADSYTLTVTAKGSASAEISVTDVAPAITGDSVTVTAGETLTVSVETAGRPIREVKIGAFALGVDDYTYADGVLTVSADFTAGLAAGEKTLLVRTAGGTAQTTFTVLEKEVPPAPAPTGCGCGSAALGGSVWLAVAMLAAVATVAARKKRA